MQKEEVLNLIRQSGVIAIMRHTDARRAIETAEALREGGVAVIEVTMNSAGAIEMIAALRERYDEEGTDIALGAGTVMDVETAEQAIAAGASLLVSPHLDEDVVAYANEHNIAVIPGAFTPTEVVRAWRAGADFVKVFPSGSVGPNYIRDLRGPLAQIPLIPTGGVTIENAAAFIRAGAAALGLGSALVDPKLVAQGEWSTLTERARAFIEAVANGRGRT